MMAIVDTLTAKHFLMSPVSVPVSIRHRIQITGDENGVGGRVRFLPYRLVVIGVFFNFGLEGSSGL